ncbi:bile acid:sodium symporter family protein [Ningiella sp. W23]|uniref:bile acid:sodium symporter family protein n=1 Tax=Ningiella sp. W23 TaxID=3023715 RepID=UPI0037572AEF
MEASIFTQVALPAVLALIMFGMGLSLEKSDFSRLLKIPKAAIIGLIGQMIVLPGFAFTLGVLFAEPAIAIGLMILAACPGGTTSNLISHIARANLALSVTLTALTTVICVISTPFIIKASIGYFEQGTATDFSLLNTSLSLLVISLVPIALGMLVRSRFSKMARRAEPKFRTLSTVFMLLLIAIISYQEREMLLDSFPSVFIIAFSLNIGATFLGIALAKLGGLSRKDGLTLGIEVGTQNATLAILIAATFIQVPEYAIAGAVYGVIMYIGAFLLVAGTRLMSPKKAL